MKIPTSNFPYYVLAHFSVLLVSFIKIPVLTTLFSPQELGVYAWCVALLAYFDIILFSWANATLWRYVYQKETVRSFMQLLAAIVPLLLVAFAVAVLLLALVTAFFITETEKTEALLLGFLTITTQQAVSVYLLYLQSQKRIRQWCLSIVAQQVTGLLLLVLLALVFKAGVKSIFLSALAFNVIFILLKVVQHGAACRQLLRSVTLTNYKLIATYSYLSILISACLMLLNNADRFLISHLKSDTALGLYAQSYSLASVGFYAAIQAFNTITAPAFNRALLHKPDPGTAAKVLELYVFLFTPALVFLLLNAKTITTILLAPPFQGYHPVFSWAAIGIYCYGVCHFLEVRLKFINRTRIVLSLLAVTAALNIVLNRMYLPVAGITVSAVISFISYLLLLLLFLFCNRSFIKELGIKTLLRDLAGSSAILAVLHFLLAQLKLFQNPIMYLFIDIAAAATIYSIFLKKHVRLLHFFFKEIT